MPPVVGFLLLLAPPAVVCIPVVFGIPPAVGFPAVFGSGVLAFSKTNMSGFECGTDNFFAAIGLSDNQIKYSELKKLTYSTKASNYRTIECRTLKNY
jgi:hypothetical protein